MVKLGKKEARHLLLELAWATPISILVGFTFSVFFSFTLVPAMATMLLLSTLIVVIFFIRTQTQVFIPLEMWSKQSKSGLGHYKQYHHTDSRIVEMIEILSSTLRIYQEQLNRNSNYTIELQEKCSSVSDMAKSIRKGMDNLSNVMLSPEDNFSQLRLHIQDVINVISNIEEQLPSIQKCANSISSTMQKAHAITIDSNENLTIVVAASEEMSVTVADIAANAEQARQRTANAVKSA